MNYASAEQKLMNRGWRIKNSLWLIPALGFGMLSWIGFLVAAIRTKKRKYWISAGAYTLAAMPVFVLIGLDEDGEGLLADIGAGIAIAIWIPATIHALIWNADYLRTLASRTPWFQQKLESQTQPAESSSFLGVSKSDYTAAGTATRATSLEPHSAPTASMGTPQTPTEHQLQQPGTVDINTARVEQLAQTIGDPSLAAHVVATRETHGAFRDLDHLAQAAGLQPHHLARFRNRVTFGHTPRPEGPETRRGGRILDI